MEFTKALGIETMQAGNGECRIEVEIQPIHLSRADRAHGGFLFTLLDTAMGRGGCGSCHTQGSCMAHCPVGLSPTEGIAGLKRMSLAAMFLGDR